MYEGPPVADEDILAICVIVNGPLEMGPGKVASQTLQVGLALKERMDADGRSDAYEAWRAQGLRTVVRVARTEAVFERALSELDGVALQDEGLTEVKRGAVTVFCTLPDRRGEQPKVLGHKKMPLL